MRSYNTTTGPDHALKLHNIPHIFLKSRFSFRDVPFLSRKGLCQSLWILLAVTVLGAVQSHPSCWELDVSVNCGGTLQLTVGQLGQLRRYIQIDILAYYDLDVIITTHSLLFAMIIQVQLQQRNTGVFRPGMPPGFWSILMILMCQPLALFKSALVPLLMLLSCALDLFFRRGNRAIFQASFRRFVEGKPRANLFKRESCSLSLQFSVQPVQPDVFGTADSKSAGTAGPSGLRVPVITMLLRPNWKPRVATSFLECHHW